MRIFVYLSLFWLASCSPATWEEIRFEGEAEIRKFAAELKQIESKEDLQKSLPKIKKRFNKMADLLIKIGDFQKKIPLTDNEREPSLASEELFVEIARIYEIPGSRELIENCQAEAVRKLDKRRSRKTI